MFAALIALWGLLVMAVGKSHGEAWGWVTAAVPVVLVTALVQYMNWRDDREAGW